MIPSAYVLGGAGSGKSTFMAELLNGWAFDPIRDLWSLPNKKNVVTLRGHQVNRAGRAGLYIGRMRDRFPGTDGLDRACSPVGADWLREFRDEFGHPTGVPQPEHNYSFIVSEGATLATRRFLTALNEYTNLLLVHLHVEPFVSDLRFLERGSNQDPSFVQATETRSSNLLSDMSRAGVQWISIDSADRVQWQNARRIVAQHLSL